MEDKEIHQIDETQAHIVKVADGIDYQKRKDAHGFTEIQAVGVMNTLAALDHLIKQGYTLCLDAKDSAHWPLDSRPNIFYMKEKAPIKQEDIKGVKTVKEDAKAKAPVKPKAKSAKKASKKSGD